MKKFRVAKCLVNGKIDEYAIFEDGSPKEKIHIDPKYGKYFRVYNELNKAEKNDFLRRSYRGRIKDAVDMIRNGNGDVIMQTKVLIMYDNVVYFLDRKIGEELREKFLKGWKDAKFGWTLKGGHKSNIMGYYTLNSKLEAIGIANSKDNPIVFETEEAAKNYMEHSIIEKIKRICKRIN